MLFDIKLHQKEITFVSRISLVSRDRCFYRGVLKDSEFIELPDYWKDLVDNKTITVHLTPIELYQYLYYTVATLEL